MLSKPGTTLPSLMSIMAVRYLAYPLITLWRRCGARISANSQQNPEICSLATRANVNISVNVNVNVT